MTPLQTLIRQISYSSLGDFNSCERYYILRKATLAPESESIDLCFGKAVGTGVQTLWLTGSLDQAKMAIFTSWTCDFHEEKPTTKKSLAHALQALTLYHPYYLLLSKDWELATINGVPCVEFSLKIEMPDGFLYRAYADLVLKHKTEKELIVQEVKTDGGSLRHEAKYENSDQGTSYSLTIDQIDPEASSFYVNYPVYYSKMMDWEFYQFSKTLVNKARWLRTSLIDIKRIKECEDTNYWPMRGANCMHFGRVCKFFGTCSLSDQALFASDNSLAEKVAQEEAKEYSFVVPLEKIVEGYLT